MCPLFCYILNLYVLIYFFLVDRVKFAFPNQPRDKPNIYCASNFVVFDSQCVNIIPSMKAHFAYSYSEMHIFTFMLLNSSWHFTCDLSKMKKYIFIRKNSKQWKSICCPAVSYRIQSRENHSVHVAVRSVLLCHHHLCVTQRQTQN